MFGEDANLLLQARLVGIHHGHAAGQHHAQPSAQLVANGGKPFRLGGLALEAVHLPRDFFKDVVDASEILLRTLQSQLGQAAFWF